MMSPKKIPLILLTCILSSASCNHYKNGGDFRDLSKLTPHQMLQKGLNDRNGIVIQRAVRLGVNINRTIQDGFTPLMIVSVGGGQYPDRNQQLIHTLIKLGADTEFRYVGVGQRTHKGMTALMMAARNAQYRLVEALLDEGASPNTTDEIGYSALHWACGPCNTVVDRVFVKSRPNIGCSKVVQMLIDAGVELAPETIQTKPINMAAKEQNWETVAILLDAGVKTQGDIVGTARRLPGRDENSWPDAIEEEPPTTVYSMPPDDDPLMTKDYLQEEPPL